MVKVPPINIEGMINIQKNKVLPIKIVGTTNVKQKINHIVKIAKRTKAIGKKITDNMIPKITKMKTRKFHILRLK